MPFPDGTHAAAEANSVPSLDENPVTTAQSPRLNLERVRNLLKRVGILQIAPCALDF